MKLKQQAITEQKALMDMIRQYKKIINDSNRETSIQSIYIHWTYYRDRRHEQHFQHQHQKFAQILDDIECMATNRRNDYQFIKDQIMMDRYSIPSTKKMAIEQCARLERQEQAFERWFHQLKQQMSPAPVRHHIYRCIKAVKRVIDQVRQSWQSITGQRDANGQPIGQYSPTDMDTYWQYVEQLTDCPYRLKSLKFQLSSLLSESGRYQYQEQEFKMLKTIVDRGHETFNRIMTDDQLHFSTQQPDWIVRYEIKMKFLNKIHQDLPMYQQEFNDLIKPSFYQPVQPTVRAQPDQARSSSPEPDQGPSWL